MSCGGWTGRRESKALASVPTGSLFSYLPGKVRSRKLNFLCNGVLRSSA